jgi:cysteine synthase A
VDQVVYVSDARAVLACRAAVREYGLLLGGTSGHVLAAMAGDAHRFDRDSVVLGISPDLGDKYLDTVYSPEWAAARLGLPAEPAEDRLRPLCGPVSEAIAARDGRPGDREDDRPLVSDLGSSR